MKKVILLTLMTVTLLTFASCTSNDETKINALGLTSTRNDSKSDEIVETEIVTEEISEVKLSDTTEDILPEEKSKKMMTRDIIYTSDAVVYDLHNTFYNEDGSISVEGYIVNETDHMADNLRVKKLELFNENNELIASNAFGYIQEHYGYVDGGNKIEVTFVFPSINVYIKDDDLDSVISVSSFTSEHW